LILASTSVVVPALSLRVMPVMVSKPKSPAAGEASVLASVRV
jgi:hypothetical protein